MPVIDIFKTAIIDALLTEPLSAGAWIRPEVFDDDTQTWEDLDTCTVCAVGATLRKAASIPGRKVSRTAYALTRGQIGSTLQATAAGDEAHAVRVMARYGPLSGLSNYHETTCRRYVPSGAAARHEYANSQEHRDRLVAFVEKHFPETFSVDTDAGQ